MQKRNESLDALRGFAILTMVLSGSIAFGGVLPSWMYHAQVPPPDHNFHPEIAGITWVDLVFPFFLFSMGASLPFSLANKIHSTPGWKVAGNILLRGFLLCFFSLFTMHVRSFINYDINIEKCLLALGAFILIHLIFVQWPYHINKKWPLVIKIISFIISIFILSQLQFKDGSGFMITRTDIIIIVLANMAVFGSAAWVLTPKKPWYRILILPFIMGVFLSGTVAGSWTEMLYKWAPVKGLYSFYYLKYLFIIIPGTIAGDWLKEYMKRQEVQKVQVGTIKSESIMVALLAWMLVFSNLAGLFGRFLIPNLISSSIIIMASIHLSNKIEAKKGDRLYGRLIKAGSYLLLLGLVFEAYQGGIKKDSSTYSYYFVTSGLAFFVLTSFMLCEGQKLMMGPIRYLAKNGKNPMVAYVAGNLILIPILYITHCNTLLDKMNGNAWTGFLRGVLFTGIVSLITIAFVKLKFFWKT